MSSSWRIRAFAVAAAAIVSVLALLVAFYPVDYDDPESWPGWYSFAQGVIPARITPGLDLQGGLHLQYQVDVDKAISDKLDRYVDDIRRVIADEHPDADATVSRLGAAAIRIQRSNGSTNRLIGDRDLRAMNLVPVREASGAMRLEMDSDYIEETKAYAIEQAIDTISRRIDDMGLTEPSIQRRGSTDIIVQLPGLSEERFDEVKELIETTAQLEFRLAYDNEAAFFGSFQVPPTAVGVTMVGGYPQSDNLTSLREAFEGLSPPADGDFGFEEVTRYDSNERTVVVVGYRARVVSGTVYLTGDTITDARVATDPQSNQPVVTMNFDSQGARAMGDMTGNNIGKGMVVILDDVIVSIATIQGRITNRGQITMGGGGTYDEIFQQAEHLSVALRNGALPAPIEKQFETYVGPTLGKQSVRNGALSLVVGFGIVFLFVLYYYKGSGAIANVALVLNLLFIFAVLALFHATLTLPGMAGITLTIGMAIDANVIIFERIKEELQLGNPVRSAIDAGYEKAFSAIVDANITTGVAALVLWQFGSGPVRGFAVTLTIGIVCSVFTAIVVTRLFFDYLVDKRRITRLSI